MLGSMARGGRCGLHVLIVVVHDVQPCHSLVFARRVTQMSTSLFDDPAATYWVLVNDEGQYSLWPTLVPLPVGWQVVGEHGTKEACLAFIEEHWINMCPSSMRRSS
jgi:MbtH protein